MHGPVFPPYDVDGHETMPALFRARVGELDQKVAMREKELGIWREITWRSFGDHARWAGLGLRSLGLERGDVVSILSDNNKEWLYVDFGTICAGGVTSGVYTTDSAEQLAYLVSDSKSKFLVVEDEEQLDKYLRMRDEMPTIRKVFVLDMEGLRDFSDPLVASVDELYGLGQAYEEQHPEVWEEEIAKAQPDDTMVLIYTSGTTGPPKGAMITHKNVISQLVNSAQANTIYPTDQQLSFLPLCHIAERTFTSFYLCAYKSMINFAESPETVPENIQEVAPTVFFAVPRIWEKFYSNIKIRVEDAAWLGKTAYRWALGVGMRRAEILLAGGKPSPVLRMVFALADFLVLHNIKTLLGLHRIRFMYTGAAPISPDLIKWYWALGLPLYELYGQTENCGVATTNTPEHLKIGTIGIAQHNTEVKLSPQGELLLRGPHVFKGYLNKPEKTAETIDTEGWLHTGDVGTMDNEGFFTITDRLKDIIITAGGKNVTPSEIENQLKFSPYISDAVIIGDKRKFLSCLVMIDEDNVMQYAQKHSIPFSNYASLCRRPEIQDLIGQEVDKVNRMFARVEQIKKFRLIDQLLTPEDDELTPTMKLKRSFVNEKYKPLIDEMYTETSQVAGP